MYPSQKYPPFGGVEHKTITPPRYQETSLTKSGMIQMEHLRACVKHIETL